MRIRERQGMTELVVDVTGVMEIQEDGDRKRVGFTDLTCMWREVEGNTETGSVR